MAKEKDQGEGPALAPKALTDEQRTIAQLTRERDTLKAQMAGTATKDVLPVKYETTNPSEASIYGEAGGTLVSITKLHKGAMRSGKRYGFAQTKAELDALVTRRNQEAGA